MPRGPGAPAIHTLPLPEVRRRTSLATTMATMTTTENNPRIRKITRKRTPLMRQGYAGPGASNTVIRCGSETIAQQAVRLVATAAAASPTAAATAAAAMSTTAAAVPTMAAAAAAVPGVVATVLPALRSRGSGRPNAAAPGVPSSAEGAPERHQPRANDEKRKEGQDQRQDSVTTHAPRLRAPAAPHTVITCGAGVRTDTAGRGWRRPNSIFPRPCSRRVHGSPGNSSKPDCGSGFAAAHPR